MREGFQVVLNCFGTVARCVVTNDINAYGHGVERYELLGQRDGRVSVDGVVAANHGPQMSRIHKIDGIILTLEIADMVVRFEELRSCFPVGLARHQPGLLIHITQPAAALLTTDTVANMPQAHFVP